jgi:lysine 2,3-aminomutase
VDAPGGGGKTPVMPTYLISQSPGKVVLRNFEGVITTYSEPQEYKNECHCPDCESSKHREGVASLLEGDQLSLEPEGLARKIRNHIPVEAKVLLRDIATEPSIKQEDLMCKIRTN